MCIRDRYSIVLYSRVPTSKGYTILYCIVPVIVHTRTVQVGTVNTVGSYRYCTVHWYGAAVLYRKVRYSTVHGYSTSVHGTYTTYSALPYGTGTLPYQCVATNTVCTLVYTVLQVLYSTSCTGLYLCTLVPGFYSTQYCTGLYLYSAILQGKVPYCTVPL